MSGTQSRTLILRTTTFRVPPSAFRVQMSDPASIFDPHPRFDLFEPGDATALVCLDVPAMQRLVIDQLDALGYKIHTGLFLEDSILKLRTHAYDVVIVSEHFNGSGLAANPILAEAAALPAAQRRRQVFVLIGASFSSSDELQAYAHNVDAVVALADIKNLRPILRRAATKTAEFYQPLHDTLAELTSAR